MSNSDSPYRRTSKDASSDSETRPFTVNSNKIHVVDVELASSNDDLSFLLNVTPTFVAQFVLPSRALSFKSTSELVSELWQLETSCQKISASFANYLGHVNVQLLLGAPLSDIFPCTNGNKELIAKWQDQNFSAQPIRHVVQNHNSEVSCLEYCFYLQTSKHNLTKFWIVARDLSNIYSNMLRANSAEEHYRTLVERPGIILSRSTTEGKLLYISPFVENFIGFSAEELMLNPELIGQIVHPDDYANYFTLLQARSNHKLNAKDAEFRVRYKDGSYRWIYERQHPKLDALGNVEYYDSIILDINEKKQLEQQLLHAQRMETLGLSVGGIAHDFNNYLAAISGQIELAIEDFKISLPNNLAQPLTHLTLAQQALLNCSAMARRLLSFSRKSEVSRTAVDIEALMNDTAKLLSYSMPDRVSVVVKIEPDTAHVLANRVELQQVLVNLGLNSRDAIEGAGVIHMSARNHNNLVEIKVRDTGSGIAAAHLPHIFDPYFTTKTQAGGSGLGLNLAYSIVQAHNGNISVKSTVGQGTEIIITLPSSAPTHETSQSSQFVSTAKGSETILVIEDDPLILSMVRSALSSHGYQVLTASSAAQALELFHENQEQIDLALLDYSMHGASGDSVIEQIYNCDDSFPILLTSGYGENLFNVPVNARHFDFIAKPYPIAELLQAIRSLLERAK